MSQLFSFVIHSRFLASFIAVLAGMFSSIFGASDEEEEEEEEEVMEEGFLSLPNEVITRIFTLLNVPDRLNTAAVNRRLNRVERKGKYYTKKLHIEMEVRFNWKTFRDRALAAEDGNEYKYHLLNEFEDLSCLERVFSSTSFGAVHVHFHLERPIYRRLMELIRDCDAEELSMEIEDRQASLGDEDAYDSVLFSLVSTRRAVVFKSHCRARLLEDGFERVYQAILDRSIPLESLEIHGYACKFVLDSIRFFPWNALNPETIWASEPSQFDVFQGDAGGFIIFHKHIQIRLPTGFEPNPTSLYFQIYDDEEKIVEERKEIDNRDDYVHRTVHRMI